MRSRFAFGKNSFLIGFRQSNVTMALAVDVHKHLSADKKGVFMDSRLRALGHIREAEDSLPQFLMKFVSWFHIFSSLGNYYRIFSFLVKTKLFNNCAASFAEVLANIHGFAKAIRHDRVFRNAASTETRDQTGFDRRHHQRAGELPSI